MPSTPFNRRAGVTQLRIQPTGAAPGLGSYVFCFGSDLPGVFVQANLNDGVELSQTADVTGIALVRFRAVLRPPSTAPVGGRWVFEWRVNATTYGSRELKAGRVLSIADGAIDTSQLSGNQTIKFRLRVAS